MKTAMQELIEWHRKSMRSYSETNKMIEAFLEKEKEHIIEAFEQGLEFGFPTNGSNYFNKTFNQNK